MCNLHDRKYVTPYAQLPHAERMVVDEARTALRSEAEALCGIGISTDLYNRDAICAYAGLPLITGYVFKSIFSPRLKVVAVVAFEMKDGQGWPERGLFAAVQAHSPDADVLRIGIDGGVQRWTLAQLLSCDLVH